MCKRDLTCPFVSFRDHNSKATGPRTTVSHLAAKKHSKVLTKHRGMVVSFSGSAHLSSGTVPVTPPQRIQLKAFINTREWCVYKLSEA